MSLQSEGAARRSFYLERYGERWEVVKVWEKGDYVTAGDFAQILNRVFATNPDERVLVEQQISIQPNGAHGVKLITDDPRVAEQATKVAARLLQGERFEQGPEDRVT